jgi:hypothetical protein
MRSKVTTFNSLSITASQKIFEISRSLYIEISKGYTAEPSIEKKLFNSYAKMKPPVKK